MTRSIPDVDCSTEDRVEADPPLRCNKWTLLLPVFLILAFRCLLLLFPLGTLARFLGLRFKATSGIDDRHRPFVNAVRDRMSFINIHYPMLGDCVPQCLAAGMMLRLRSVDTTLHFGVIKSPFPGDPLQAHAWLSAGSIVVTGGGSSAVYQELGLSKPSNT
ncbi:lasso peptide biosynthesis B2 protein [Terriglobus sp. RCC_193]|uniref:lasso peptide biosynthesis B2 protein n=1 Tax=Terriglobus sp. RCC_193 TaxID=3239218 RepID=UPI0035232C90